MTHHGTSGADAPAVVAVLLCTALALGYGAMAARRHREARGWSAARTGSFLIGAGLLAVGLLPEVSLWPVHDFRTHMQQHLLVGMLAPLALVLGAPVTLLLRSLPRHHARSLTAVLRSRPAHLLTHPALLLTLSLGGLWLLYWTPLYQRTMEHPSLHHLVHIHLLLVGVAFAWVIAGPDPAPKRPSVRARLVLLGMAVAGHSMLSQLLYAGVGVRVPVPAVQLRGGAELMYYVGDLAELALALALLATWRPTRIPAAVAQRPRGVIRPSRPATSEA